MEKLKILTTITPVFILLIGVFPGQSAGLTCYSCTYNRGDADVQCLSNPSATNRVECDGLCMTRHVWAAVDMVTQLLERGCLNSLNETGCFNDTLGSFPNCLRGCCPSLCNTESTFPLPEQETDCPTTLTDSVTTSPTTTDAGGSGALRASLLIVSSLGGLLVLHGLH